MTAGGMAAQSRMEQSIDVGGAVLQLVPTSSEVESIVRLCSRWRFRRVGQRAALSFADGLVRGGQPAAVVGLRSAHGVDASSWAATLNSRSSRRVCAVSITPIGAPSVAVSSGRLIEGCPVVFEIGVKGMRSNTSSSHASAVEYYGSFCGGWPAFGGPVGLVGQRNRS